MPGRVWIEIFFGGAPRRKISNEKSGPYSFSEEKDARKRAAIKLSGANGGMVQIKQPGSPEGG